MYFSLPQLFVSLFDALIVAVFCNLGQICNFLKSRLVLKSLSLCDKILSYYLLVSVSLSTYYPSMDRTT